MPTIARETPTILVAFGITGDLMKLKVIPALFRLFQQEALPTRLRIIGFSRKEWSDDDLRSYLRDIVTAHTSEAPGASLEQFLELFQFETGDFSDKASYERLKEAIKGIDAQWGICSNKLFYLAISPKFYEAVADDLAQSGLTNTCDTENGWTHVVVEKPFGDDGETATRIEDLLGKLFEERQIYRIDHYLAKEMLQEVLYFRFANNLFEGTWNNEHIERIDIRLFERVGAEKRGPFYDHVGALRDIGQNHLLQMLALITMEQPASFSAEDIRSERAAILEKLEIPSDDSLTENIRGQYEGYRSIPGVDPESLTETYFRVNASLATPRWQGVPIVLEGGKRMGDPLKEIVITFKHPEPCLCPPGEHAPNTIMIRLEPNEDIRISFVSKKPGLSFEAEPRELSFRLREHEAVPQYTEEYERLLLDCIRGDQTLFVSAREVQAMWRYTDPIVRAWKESPDQFPLISYPADTRDFLTNLDS